jgi:hypothetical protein
VGVRDTVGLLLRLTVTLREREPEELAVLDSVAE